MIRFQAVGNIAFNNNENADKFNKMIEEMEKNYIVKDVNMIYEQETYGQYPRYLKYTLEEK